MLGALQEGLIVLTRHGGRTINCHGLTLRLGSNPDGRFYTRTSLLGLLSVIRAVVEARDESVRHVDPISFEE